MINPQELSSATVLELRRIAKEHGITLGSLKSKADILQRVQEGLSEQLSAQLQKAAPKAPAPAAPAPAASARPAAPERRATIISDDGEDGHAPARPAPAPPPRATTSTGKNKPAFSLAGARAWHNPQPFAAPQQPGRFGGQGGAAGAPVQPPPRVSRFGPNAQPAEEHRPAPAAPAAGPAIAAYRPSAFAQPVAEQRPVAPAPAAVPAPAAADALSAYRRPVPAYQPPAAEPVPARPAAPAREAAGINPAVPGLLATGDCGDGAGVLEVHPDGYGFLRCGNFLPGKTDVYVSNAQIRRFQLMSGDYVEGKTRPQREGDRYAALLYITRINGEDAEEQRKRREFDELTPVYPNRRIQLSDASVNDHVLRLIDLFVPIGFGQRALIVAPPKAGKTTILKKIALSVRDLHPEIHLMMLLVDERPEEVTDLKETVGGDIFHSTFDEPAESHVRVSELVLERAMRLVEQGRDVVILMDSLTRLSRAYNTLAPNSARIMSGGLAAGALNKPKRFFGAARNIKEGGSLTIIATAIVDTGSRMDDVIYEEFKGTGNMELTLDRSLQELRLFPAVSITKSGTRHEELLLSTEERSVSAKVRSMIAGASEQQGISLVLSMMEKTKDNEDFVARYDNWARMMAGGKAD